MDVTVKYELMVFRTT